MCSVDAENGHFLTIDPKYDFHTFPESRPIFNKTKMSKKVATTDGDGNVDDVHEFVKKIKHVDLYKYRDCDSEFYQETIEGTFALCEEEIITPHVTQTFGLHEVNEAIKVITEKKCTGKVLIDVTDSEVPKKDDKADDDDNKSNSNSK